MGRSSRLPSAPTPRYCWWSRRGARPTETSGTTPRLRSPISRFSSSTKTSLSGVSRWRGSRGCRIWNDRMPASGRTSWKATKNSRDTIALQSDDAVNSPVRSEIPMTMRRLTLPLLLMAIVFILMPAPECQSAEPGADREADDSAPKDESASARLKYMTTALQKYTVVLEGDE